MNKPTETSLKVKVIAISLLFVVIVKIVDIAFFHFYFQIPNEMEWDTSPWYNFLHYNKNTKFESNERGIIIAGSSVALYSIIPETLETSLNKESKDKKNKVRFYSHVAMSPTDFYYYLPDLISKKPEVVVYLVNPVDFQLDRFYEERLEKDGNNLKYSTLIYRNPDLEPVYNEEARVVAYANHRYPVKLFYPLEFLFDHYRELSKKEIFAIFTKYILLMNRYRLFLNEPIRAWMEHHTRKSRSYHNYTGIIPREGIWRKGWTSKNFTVDCELKKGKLTESIFAEEAGTILKVFQDKNEIANLEFQKKGWKDLEINFGENNKIITLNFEVNREVSSKSVDPLLKGKEYFYGVRLSQNFCKNEISQNISYSRISSIDDSELYKMSSEEYKIDYEKRLYEDSERRPEIRRLYNIALVKKELGRYPFRNWSEFDYFKKSIDKLKNSGVKVIIVNNPENPLESFFHSSTWYSGYLNWMSSLEDKDKIIFYDYKDNLKEARYFIDAHHFTYGGMEMMNEIYSRLIQSNF